MARKHYYIDNEEIGEADAFDENGVMRDGVTTRFPMFMTDSAGNVLTDAFNEPLGPRWTCRGYVFSDNSNRPPPSDDDHPDVRKFALSNAWKGGHFEPGDAMIYEGKVMVGTKYTDESHVEFVDIRSGDGDKLKQDAYKQYKEHLSGAWKKQKEPKEREWEVAGPLSNSQRAEIKEQAWRDSVTDLENAWRK